MKLALLLTASFLLASLPAALAEDAPDAEDIVQSLKPKTRSMVPARGIDVAAGKIPDELPQVSLYVNFDYNSAKLKQDSLIVLERLADALNDDRLSEFTFLVAGHTDAKGPNAYNQKLSQRRAAAVKQFLVSRRHVATARLVDKGYGETRLLDSAEPESGVNRRVQIVNIFVPPEE